LEGGEGEDDWYYGNEDSHRHLLMMCKAHPDTDAERPAEPDLRRNKSTANTTDTQRRGRIVWSARLVRVCVSRNRGITLGHKVRCCASE
jgi:hypothetical protein